MNILLLLVIGGICFWVGYRVYAMYVSRQMGVVDEAPTPAVRQTDGKDYVPTKTSVIFAHHYATIAGVGPIVGPTLAVVCGILPAVFWVILGGILFGAVHDFASLFVSTRQKGESMAAVTRSTLGNAGFYLFILFTIVMIILVTSAFLSLTAISLTSRPLLSELGLDTTQTILRTQETVQGTVGVIGGIASTSVIIITLMAPLLGYLLYKRGISTTLGYMVAAAVAMAAVLVGIRAPLTLDPTVWMVILSIYVMFAATIPVWVILQPRDFINSQILYLGLAALFFGTIIGGLKGISLGGVGQIPLLDVSQGVEKIGWIWPMLFIFIACGAISGFHALVGGGTTGKQVSKERDTRRVGYGAMLLESVLALLVIIALGVGLSKGSYIHTVWPEGAAGNPILGFALSVAGLMHSSFGLSMTLGSVLGILMVEGFAVTTLDSAVRLNCYLFEELWRGMSKNPAAIFKNRVFNASISVVVMFYLAYSQSYKAVWPIFGAANQLLAALTLISVSVWLFVRGLKSWYTIVPAAFMTVTTIASLIYKLFQEYLPKGMWTVVVVDILLLMLSIALIMLVAGKARQLVAVRRKATAGVAAELA
jgi:carbon starvation protein